ncbi:hypothetical protein Tco_0650555 [Tanacetum coccineum]
MATNEETNAAGTDTRPPMLVENDYESWKIRIHRYIRGKPNGKLIWKSIQNDYTSPDGTDTSPYDSTIHGTHQGRKLDSEFNEEETNLRWLIFKLKSFLVKMLMQGSGRTLQQRKEDLFDEYERFRAIGNESIHDYFLWGKYVTMSNRNWIISTTPYVQIYTHLKDYEPHAKDSQEGNRSSLTCIVDSLAYVAHTTSAHALSSPHPKHSSPSPQPTAQSSE